MGERERERGREGEREREGGRERGGKMKISKLTLSTHLHKHLCMHTSIATCT